MVAVTRVTAFRRRVSSSDAEMRTFRRKVRTVGAQLLGYSAGGALRLL